MKGKNKGCSESRLEAIRRGVRLRENRRKKLINLNQDE